MVQWKSISILLMSKASLQLFIQRHPSVADSEQPSSTSKPVIKNDIKK